MSPIEGRKADTHRPRPSAPGRSEFRFWTEEKLRNIDTDQFKHVNNSVIASLLEAGRMEVYATPEARLLLPSPTLAVVRLEVDFHRELFYPGTARIGSRIVSVGRTSFSVRQGIFDAESCVASALATCVLFDPAERKAVPVAAELRDFLLRAS
jgi:acyl-CoA thioester hydrolase